ncbi:MAG: 4-phosphoerythronate dehydrogenase, partial [Bacteroidetes bacterium]|nr:4-phosphoerythronate dehydrogenase [Bacteroidota bacterium]
MHIVADENMPYVRDAFGTLGTVRLMAGRAIRPADVRDADVLLVRSVTRVDAELLAGSRVRFVGSATIGTDHVDQDSLAARGIGFAHAPGS